MRHEDCLPNWRTHRPVFKTINVKVWILLAAIPSPRSSALYFLHELNEALLINGRVSMAEFRNAYQRGDVGMVLANR